MIDRDGLFSPTATGRGEPDSDKLAYLSLRRNGMLDGTAEMELAIAVFHYKSSYFHTVQDVMKSAKYDYATVGFGVTKEGFPFALLVPMSSLLYHSGGRDWSVCAVTMAVYWGYVSLKSVVEFSAGSPLSDDWKVDFPLLDEDGHLIERGRLRIYADGDIIFANGVDGECLCGLVSAEGEFGYGKELTDSQLVDSREFKV